MVFRGATSLAGSAADWGRATGMGSVFGTSTGACVGPSARRRGAADDNGSVAAGSTGACSVTCREAPTPDGADRNAPLSAATVETATAIDAPTTTARVFTRRAGLTFEDTHTGAFVRSASRDPSTQISSAWADVAEAKRRSGSGFDTFSNHASKAQGSDTPSARARAWAGSGGPAATASNTE